MASEIFDGPYGKTTVKHPNKIRNYVFDWSAWLSANNTTAASMAVESITGVAQVSITVNLTSGLLTVQVSGGSDGGTGTLTVSMTTADGQKDIRTLYFQISAA